MNAVEFVRVCIASYEHSGGGREISGKYANPRRSQGLG